MRQVTVLCALFAVISSTSYAADAVDLDTGLLRDAFEAADTSGDGRVDEGECAADAVAAFVTVDRDGDDRVSVEELLDAGVASIGSLDVDGDDHLTIIEVMNAKLAEFESDGIRDNRVFRFRIDPILWVGNSACLLQKRLDATFLDGVPVAVKRIA